MFKRLQELLKKLADGSLTDAERTELAGLDAQKIADEAAAAARRTAEQKQLVAEQQLEGLKTELQDLKTKLEAEADKGKPEAEKLQREIERLKAQVTERDGIITTMKAEAKKLVRDRTLDEVLRKAGIAFIEGVDTEAMSGILRARLEALPEADLADPTKTAPLVEAFAKSNAAIIADTTGHGSGGGPRQKTAAGGDVNPWKKETMNLTKQGEIAKRDPALAKRMQAEAGAK